MKKIIKCGGSRLSVFTHHFQQHALMYFVYSNIWTYSSYENHSWIINIVSAYADVFWILYSGHRLSGPGYSDYLLLYVNPDTKDAISLM